MYPCAQYSWRSTRAKELSIPLFLQTFSFTRESKTRCLKRLTIAKVANSNRTERKAPPYDDSLFTPVETSSADKLYESHDASRSLSSPPTWYMRFFLHCIITRKPFILFQNRLRRTYYVVSLLIPCCSFKFHLSIFNDTLPSLLCVLFWILFWWGRPFLLWNVLWCSTHSIDHVLFSEHFQQVERLFQKFPKYHAQTNFFRIFRKQQKLVNNT